jgi:outer membrane protein TolC
VPQADVLRLQAEVASTQLQLIGAQSSVRIATGRLNTAMGSPVETPLTIATDPATPPPIVRDLGAAINHALAHRPELASDKQRTAAARAAIEAARAGPCTEIARRRFLWFERYGLVA